MLHTYNICKKVGLMIWDNRDFWIKIYDIRKRFNQIRCNICKKEILHTAKSVGKNLTIGGPSKVTRHTIIGDGVCFNGMNITGSGEVKIGRYFHSGIECMIITQSHDYDNGDRIPYGTENISKPVLIEDFVWLGSRVTILPGAKIGEGAIIQAGSVVHGEIPPYAIAGGNPATVFKYRDIEHFNKLKEEQKFK